VVAGATSYFIKILTDYIIPEGNLKLLKIAGLAAIIILIVSLIFSYFKSMIALRMGLRVDKKVISKFLAHTVKLPQNFFDLRKSGEISSRFFESFKVRLLLTDITISLIISFISLVTAFIFMFTIYKPLALAALLFIPIYIGIYLFFDSINKENIWKMAEEMSGFESFVNDTIKSMKSIKYFGMEKFYEQRGVIVIDKMNNQIQKSGFNFIVGASVNESLTKILTFSVLILGAGSVLNNQLTTGDLLSFFTLLALFSTPLSQIAGIGKEVRSGLVTAERIFEITQLETEWKNEGQKSIPDDFEYISLENLSFRYPNRSALLINTNIRIEKGTITLLRGKNGSGKSTIGALLTGIYKADSGRVTIDGIDIDNFKLDEWRNFISIVPQNLEILTGTLLENIVPGVKEINFERLFGIIEELHLTDFLNRLPMGLETMLTENILLLSRGEQQRIAVARAVYRNPGVLILDEATASLDAISEAAIVSLIIKLKNEGCTILMITHKESDFAIADKIIEL
jgi:ATP-binding cassette subfamily B protein